MNHFFNFRSMRLIVLIAILSIVYSIANFISVWQITNYKIVNIEKTLTTRFSQSIGKSILNQMLFSDPAIFQGLISSLVDRKNILFAYIINNEGEYIVHTFDKVIPQDLVAKVNYQQKSAVMNTRRYGKVLVSSTPLYHGKLGYLVIGQDLPDLTGLWLGLGALTALLLIIYILFFRHFILRPIQELSKGAEIIGKGNLDYKIHMDREDEIGEFSRVFEKMRLNLKKTTSEINDINDKLLKTNKELEVARDQALHGTKAKSLFLASMSHELRTPLNSVIGFTNVLLKNKKKNLEEKELQYLARILKNGEHLLELINDILDLSKIEAGKMDLYTERISLKNLINETIDQLEGRILGKNLKLIPQISEQIGEIRTDSHKLKQILINLVGNAIKFTEEGSITVQALVDDKDASIKINVIDTGIGIPEEKLNKIFEAFQQADYDINRKYEGTGLGLTISRSLINLMDYQLDVKSELNKGSTFSVIIPKSAQKIY